MEENRRQYGPDALRILSILFVQLLHTQGLGGLLPAAERLSLNYSIAWLVDIIAYSAVDCFVLMAGYFGYTHKTRYAHLAGLWIQAAFYSVTLTLFFTLHHGTFSPLGLVKSFLPLSNGYYWYFTAYFGMYLLSPMLNAAVRAMGKRETITVLAAVLLFFCTIPCVVGDLFGLSQGYSVLWFCVVYLVGAALRKYDAAERFSSKKLALGAAILILVTWLSKLLMETVLLRGFGIDTGASVLIRYLSPTVLGTGICYMLIFVRLKPGERVSRVIQRITLCVFGAYLICDHPLVKKYAVVDRFAWLASGSVLRMVAYTLGIAVLSLLLCLCVEWVRLLLFRPLRIPQTLRRWEDKLRKKLSVISE